MTNVSGMLSRMIGELFENMSVEELRNACKKWGIKSTKMTKAEMVAALKAAK